MSETREKFWMVWSPQGQPPVHQHWRKQAAMQEAARLARNNPDRTFVVLESLADVCVPETPVAWTGHAESDDEEPDLPF